MTTFAVLAPDLAPALQELGQSGLATFMKANFPHFQVAHLISLFVLGGCVIVLNLRLVGVGFPDAPSIIERHLRSPLRLSAAAAVLTGVLIGIANPMKLYLDTPFVVKMAALLAGLVVTFGVTAPVARADGAVRGLPLGLFLAGLSLWGAGLWVFATTLGSSPGMILVLAAAGLVLLISLRGRARWLYLGGLGFIVAAHQAVTHVMISDPYDVARLDPANKLFTLAEGLWILVFAALLVVSPGRPDATGRLARLIGFCGLLIWVTVAAAGRWIAFG